MEPQKIAIDDSAHPFLQRTRRVQIIAEAGILRKSDEQREHNCVDGLKIVIPAKNAIYEHIVCGRVHQTYRSQVLYGTDKITKDFWGQISVSGVLFNRKMTTVIRGSVGLKTITFPKTVRKIRMGAFYHVKSLQGAVVNSRIQRLTWKMRYKSEAQDEVKGIFQDTGLKYIRLPRRLKEIGEFTFKNCSKLLKTHFPASLR